MTQHVVLHGSFLLHLVEILYIERYRKDNQVINVEKTVHFPDAKYRPADRVCRWRLLCSSWAKIIHPLLLLGLVVVGTKIRHDDGIQESYLRRLAGDAKKSGATDGDSQMVPLHGRSQRPSDASPWLPGPHPIFSCRPCSSSASATRYLGAPDRTPLCEHG